MASRSCRNMSGCWSYFVLMYCRMTDDREMWFDRRNGRDNTWDVLQDGRWSACVGFCYRSGGDERRHDGHWPVAEYLDEQNAMGYAGVRIIRPYCRGRVQDAPYVEAKLGGSTGMLRCANDFILQAAATETNHRFSSGARLPGPTWHGRSAGVALQLAEPRAPPPPSNRFGEYIVSPT